MIEAFLICALALPASNFARPPILSWFAQSKEEDQLREWLKRGGDIKDVFIHEAPQEDKLKEHGWERVPFTYKGKQIWIKRKQQDDQKKLQECA